MPLSASEVIPIEVLTSTSADRLLLTAPGQVTAGGSFTLGVAAANAANDTDPSYHGLVTLAVYVGPQGGRLVGTMAMPIVNGVGTFNSLALTAPGSYTLLAATNGDLQAAVATINVGAVPQLAVALTPANKNNSSAGQQFNVVVTALIASKQDNAYSGTVHITSSDLHAVLPADFALVKGTASFAVTLNVPGKQTVTVMDDSLASLHATSNSTLVSGAPSTGIDHFVVSGFPTSVVANTSAAVTVTAVDVYGKPVASYAGSAQLTSSVSGFTPLSLHFTPGGVARTTVTLKTLGIQSLIATDTNGKTGAETGINVVSPATHLLVTADRTSIGAGEQVTFTVTAATGPASATAPDTRFTDSLQLIVGDPNATVLAQPISGGVQKFTVTMPTAGSWTVSVLDSTRPKITGPNVKIAVAPGVVTQLMVTGYPLFTLAGALHPVTVTAEDALGNVVTSFSDTVSVAGAPAHAFKPDDQGRYVFSTALALGQTTVTASDTTHQGALSGKQTGITVVNSIVSLAANPSSQGVNDLVVLAPAGGGTIVITPSNSDGTAVAVQINGKAQQVPSGAAAQLVVYGGSGPLTVKEMPAMVGGNLVYVGIPALIFGGTGENTLSAAGSDAPTLLVGGPGSDTLTAGTAPAVLIGGGVDTLTAGIGSDLLIGGSSRFDADPVALAALLAEWASSDSYAQRVQALFNGTGGVPALNPGTRFADTGGNTLIGSKMALDWFIDSTTDRLSNVNPGEVITSNR